MEYTIYLRTNLINGKHYVGQTSDFRRRERQWYCLKQTYANKHLLKDRELYGLDNWSVEILAECDTREESWSLEQYYIDKFDSIYPNGYNLAKGGSGTNGVILSDETKKKISEAKKGENHPMFGKHHSDETRKKMSEAHKGKQLAEETKKKMSEAKPKKQVHQYTLDGKLVKVWESTNECGRNGFNRSNVSQCCNGKLRKHKGYIWSYVPL